MHRQYVVCGDLRTRHICDSSASAAAAEKGRDYRIRRRAYCKVVRCVVSQSEELRQLSTNDSTQQQEHDRLSENSADPGSLGYHTLLTSVIQPLGAETVPAVVHCPQQLSLQDSIRVSWSNWQK